MFNHVNEIGTEREVCFLVLPMGVKWPSSLTQNLSFLDELSTFSRQFTSRTVHFHPFGPYTSKFKPDSLETHPFKDFYSNPNWDWETDETDEKRQNCDAYKED